MLWLYMVAALGAPSELYGSEGASWDRDGRLPDFSYAGYRRGEGPIPERPVVASVADFGGVGDGVVDDTAALQAAIDATSGGALLIPAGTWRVTDVLAIDHSDLVLRGAGREETVLLVEQPLAEVRGARPQWSWEGGFLWFEPAGGGEPLTDVVAAASRGDTTLQVADASGIAAGDRVLLTLTDDAEGTLGWHLHNGQEPGGDCSWQQTDRHRWPVRVDAVEGDELTLAQPLRHDVDLAWAPTLSTAPALDEVGVESLTVRFPEVDYAGHLNEPGYNGVYFTGGVWDGWVRDVAFENSDNGILTGLWTKHLTFEGIHFAGRRGHHGFNIAYAADCLAADVTFEAPFRHEITVDHKTNGCVFKRVASEAFVDLDHHRDAPFENLFTDFTAETTFLHGGSQCAGWPAGARGTFWGLPGPLHPPYWGHIQTNVVGELAVEDLRTPDREWYEHVVDLEPTDLHRAQLDLRLGIVPDDPPRDPSGDDPDVPAACGCGGGAPAGWLGPLLAGFALRRRR